MEHQQHQQHQQHHASSAAASARRLPAVRLGGGSAFKASRHSNVTQTTAAYSSGSSDDESSHSQSGNNSNSNNNSNNNRSNAAAAASPPSFRPTVRLSSSIPESQYQSEVSNHSSNNDNNIESEQEDTKINAASDVPASIVGLEQSFRLFPANMATARVTDAGPSRFINSTSNTNGSNIGSNSTATTATTSSTTNMPPHVFSPVPLVATPVSPNAVASTTTRQRPTAYTPAVSSSIVRDNAHLAGVSSSTTASGSDSCAHPSDQQQRSLNAVSAADAASALGNDQTPPVNPTILEAAGIARGTIVRTASIDPSESSGPRSAPRSLRQRRILAKQRGEDDEELMRGAKAAAAMMTPAPTTTATTPDDRQSISRNFNGDVRKMTESNETKRHRRSLRRSLSRSRLSGIEAVQQDDALQNLDSEEDNEDRSSSNDQSETSRAANNIPRIASGCLPGAFAILRNSVGAGDDLDNVPDDELRNAAAVAAAAAAAASMVSHEVSDLYSVQSSLTDGVTLTASVRPATPPLATVAQMVPQQPHEIIDAHIDVDHEPNNREDEESGMSGERPIFHYYDNVEKTLLGETPEANIVDADVTIRSIEDDADTQKVSKYRKWHLIIALVCVVGAIIAIVSSLLGSKCSINSNAKGCPDLVQQTSAIGESCDFFFRLSDTSPELFNTVDASAVLTPECGRLNMNDPSAWLRLPGSGKPIHVAIRPYGPVVNHWLSVYKSNCTTLQCHSFLTESCPQQGCDLTFPTESGETYSIVTGAQDTFSFSVETDETFASDVCEQSESLDERMINSDQEMITVEASNADATFDELPSFCSEDLDAAPSTWYSITGTGSPMQASTCDSLSEPVTTVVLGGACGSLRCLSTASSVPCGNGQNSVTWFAAQGVVYHIVTSGGVTENSDGSRSGSHELTITTRQDNDICGLAEPVAIQTGGTLVLGSNSGASGDDVPSCNRNARAIPNEWASSWYEVDGTGGSLIATTCSENTGEAFVQVFEGSCGEISCVSGSQSKDCSSGGQNEVTWSSEKDKKYYMLVSSPEFGGIVDEKSFELFVQKAAENEFCRSATEISLDGAQSTISIPGSTAAGTTADQFGDFCGPTARVTAPGAWYTVVGKGAVVRADTCLTNGTDPFDFDTQITIYSGSDCDLLACVWGNDDYCGKKSSLSWHALDGERYYIFVHGHDSQTGDFTLNFHVEDDELMNSRTQCNDELTPLTLNSTVQFATVFGVQLSHGSVCGGFPTFSPTVWYHLIGTGKPMRVTSCGETTDFNSVVSIFRGDSCDHIECMTADYGKCPMQITSSAVTVNQAYGEFESELGARYYVIVHGRNGDSGIFSLRVEEL